MPAVSSVTQNAINVDASTREKEKRNNFRFEKFDLNIAAGAKSISHIFSPVRLA